MIQKLKEPKKMESEIKHNLIRYFENMTEHDKLQAFLFAMNFESDRQYLIKCSKEYKKFYFFDPVDNIQGEDLL